MIEREMLRSASKGPKKRDPACLQVQTDIVIPRGTILRQEPGKEGTFVCALAGGKFVIERIATEVLEGSFKLVTAA